MVVLSPTSAPMLVPLPESISIFSFANNGLAASSPESKFIIMDISKTVHKVFINLIVPDDESSLSLLESLMLSCMSRVMSIEHNSIRR